ncbi:MAG: aryl-sulfate sulfotransferase [Ectothiorhodospiraceae bacterium]|nr:aryl-sulfate sulfotransferase [Ectothiorhodospiraceae bacterium]
MSRNHAFATSVALVAALATATATIPAAGFEVALVPSVPSGQPVGTTVDWSVTTTGATPDTTLVRFEVLRPDGTWQMVRDIIRDPTLRWMPQVEGDYVFRAIALDLSSNETGQATAGFQVGAIATSSARVVATTHPLVALYSVPPCITGYVRVRYRLAVTGAAWQRTGWQRCGERSNGFLVGGMWPTAGYMMQHEHLDGAVVSRGVELGFGTGPVALESALPAWGHTGANIYMSLEQPVVLTSLFGPSINTLVATDVLGAVVWYHESPGRGGDSQATLLRPVRGGTFLVIDSDRAAQSQVLREIDLVGNTIRETNPVAINFKLAASGRDPINSFHHDAVRLPDGRTAVLTYVERFLEDVQGPGLVPVVGDAILVLDTNWDVVWTWSAFDHLDQSRKALGDSRCLADGSAGCLITIAPEGNDWTHGNSLHYTPDDGNLVVSLRHQDWVVKVDYRDGAGSGAVVWRLGREGDFTFVSDDPWPEFSHQHDARLDGGLLSVFDNGNMRVQALGGGNSRGQVLAIDEQAMTVEPVLNLDLGHFAPFVGSAQVLRNGNLHVNVGAIDPGPGGYSQSVELHPSGPGVFYNTWAALAGRSFRMRSLYEP